VLGILFLLISDDATDRDLITAEHVEAGLSRGCAYT
jgi:hypothetical protein